MDQTKEQRYEKLVKAVAGGELAMVKYLWELLERFESVVDETPQAKVARMQREVDDILKKLKKNPPKDGKTGERGRPGAPGRQGKPGRDGRDGRDGEDGRDGVDGKDGKDGKNGSIPDHEWDGTKIRFENPDGTWGEWVDIRGPQGRTGESFGPADGGGLMHSPITVRQGGTRFEGVSEIVIGANLTATRTPNGISIAGENGGGGGGNINFETPSGTVNDSNVTFTVANEPLYLVVNGAQIFEGAGYSYSGGTITLDNAIGTGGFIRSAYGSGISVETPTGTVDDNNTSFTVANEPLYVVINGAQYFDGAGYSYSGGTITLDNPVGVGGIIRSIY